MTNITKEQYEVLEKMEHPRVRINGYDNYVDLYQSFDLENNEMIYSYKIITESKEWF